MDTITDLLSTIFVSEYSRKRKFNTIENTHTEKNDSESETEKNNSESEKNSVIDLTTSKETIQIQTDADFLVDEDSNESIETRTQTILANEFYQENEEQEDLTEDHKQNYNEKQTQTDFEYNPKSESERLKTDQDNTTFVIRKKDIGQKETRDIQTQDVQPKHRDTYTQDKKRLSTQDKRDNETLFTRTELPKKEDVNSYDSDTELSDTMTYSSDTVDLGLKKKGDLIEEQSNEITKIKNKKDDIFSDESEECKFDIKKYVLRPSELYKKNILIANIDKHDNINILSDLINSFSAMEDVEKIYNQDMYIITNKDNKKMFKKMLLDNPYLHFMNIHIKSQTKPIDTNDKKTIVIIHLQSVDDIIIQDSDKLQYIIVSDKIEDKLLKAYEKLGEDKILLHKKESTKALQKTFFKKVIQYICEDINELDFTKYYEFINQKKFGLKYIILKGHNLRYY